MSLYRLLHIPSGRYVIRYKFGLGRNAEIHYTTTDNPAQPGVFKTYMFPKQLRKEIKFVVIGDSKSVTKVPKDTSKSIDFEWVKVK